MKPGDYVRAFVRDWLVILSCTLLGLGLVSLVLAQQAQTYTSTSRLVVAPNITAATTNSDAYTGTLLARERMSSYAGLATGTAVAEKVIEELDLELTPAELSAQVDAAQIGTSTVLEITVTGSDPTTVPEINRVVLESTQRAVARIDRPREGGRALLRAEISDPPAGTPVPTERNSGRKQAAGALAGLLVGLGVAAARGRVRPRLRDAEDASAVTDAPLLGEVSCEPHGDGSPSHLLVPGPADDAFRVVRQKLLARHETRSPLVIAAPSSHEDVIATALGLAASIAATGCRCLVVDAAFRDPRLAQRLLPDTPSLELNAWWCSDSDWKAAVVDVAPGLAVLPTPALVDDPSALVDSPTLADVLHQLTLAYGFVVVVADPVATSPDAAILAARGRGALLLAERGVSRMVDLEGAARQMREMGAELLGVVVESGRRSRSSSRRGRRA